MPTQISGVPYHMEWSLNVFFFMEDTIISTCYFNMLEQHAAP
jgi:hypothetical protein